MARQKELEVKNRRLKKMYNEVRLKVEIVAEAMAKMVKLSRQHELAKNVNGHHQVNIRAACQAFSISETCYRYRPKLSSQNAEFADLLIRLTHNQRNW